MATASTYVGRVRFDDEDTGTGGAPTGLVAERCADASRGGALAVVAGVWAFNFGCGRLVMVMADQGLLNQYRPGQLGPKITRTAVVRSNTRSLRLFYGLVSLLRGDSVLSG